MIATRTSTLRHVVNRSVARRQMATTPKMHTTKEKWGDLLATRPPKDHMDEHLVFHPPYNGIAVGVGLATCWCLGYGSMGFGMMWQQKKQGYWK